MLPAVAATAAFAAPDSITCVLGPPWQGLRAASLASPSSLQWSKKQRQCKRKAGPSSICAKFELMPPPYPLDALEPHMSKETLEYHWAKHHRGYVDNLNKQIEGTELDELSLEDIILATHNKGDLLPPFNNAAQIWNHDFFWESMKPGGGGRPSGELLELINRDFGSFERFVDDIRLAAATQFGSGWAWLAYKSNRLDVENAVNPNPSYEDKKLVVVKSPNAVNPLIWDYSPLLTIDVWEHAYYLDYQNRRADYISIFLEKLVSWEAVSSRLEIAKARAVEREEEERRKREEEEKAVSSRLEIAKARAVEREEEERRKREEEEKASDGEVAEIYVDSKSDDSEAE